MVMILNLRHCAEPSKLVSRPHIRLYSFSSVKCIACVMTTIAYQHHRARIKSLPYFMDDSVREAYFISIKSKSVYDSLKDILSAVLPLYNNLYASNNIPSKLLHFIDAYLNARVRNWFLFGSILHYSKRIYF